MTLPFVTSFYFVLIRCLLTHFLVLCVMLAVMKHWTIIKLLKEKLLQEMLKVGGLKSC